MPASEQVEDNAYFLTEAERILLIESLCNEQSWMLKNNPEAYASERWVMLENLKVRFKE